jgi:hypothetical protein
MIPYGPLGIPVLQRLVVVAFRNLLACNLTTRSLITARTASAATADALDFLILFQLLSRHAADACAVEVGLLGLDAAQAAKLLQKGKKSANVSCDNDYHVLRQHSPSHSPASSTLRSASHRRSCS